MATIVLLKDIVPRSRGGAIRDENDYYEDDECSDDCDCEDCVFCVCCDERHNDCGCQHAYYEYCSSDEADE